MRQYAPVLTLEECMAKLGGKQVLELKENVTPAIFPCDKNLVRKIEENKAQCITATSLKHGADSDDEFDPKQLAAGIKVEKEHTDNELVAKSIAKAHLKEDPLYYKKLATIEKK
jgi:hypothetical protein